MVCLAGKGGVDRLSGIQQDTFQSRDGDRIGSGNLDQELAPIADHGVGGLQKTSEKSGSGSGGEIPVSDDDVLADVKVW